MHKDVEKLFRHMFSVTITRLNHANRLSKNVNGSVEDHTTVRMFSGQLNELQELIYRYSSISTEARCLNLHTALQYVKCEFCEYCFRLVEKQHSTDLLCEKCKCVKYCCHNHKQFHSEDHSLICDSLSYLSNVDLGKIVFQQDKNECSHELLEKTSQAAIKIYKLQSELKNSSNQCEGLKKMLKSIEERYQEEIIEHQNLVNSLNEKYDQLQRSVQNIKLPQLATPVIHPTCIKKESHTQTDSGVFGVTNLIKHSHDACALSQHLKQSINSTHNKLKRSSFSKPKKCTIESNPIGLGLFVSKIDVSNSEALTNELTILLQKCLTTESFHQMINNLINADNQIKKMLASDNWMFLARVCKLQNLHNVLSDGLDFNNMKIKQNHSGIIKKKINNTVQVKRMRHHIFTCTRSVLRDQFRYYVSKLLSENFHSVKNIIDQHDTSMKSLLETFIVPEGMSRRDWYEDLLCQATTMKDPSKRSLTEKECIRIDALAPTFQHDFYNMSTIDRRKIMRDLIQFVCAVEKREVNVPVLNLNNVPRGARPPDLSSFRRNYTPRRFNLS
ncbi:N utilization substance protein B [Acrasis kona]|uniref:N utilization substance protein B n=1 Tax=Acrasis kona TaxID=1008807 RepID=A0AAW2YLP1_9EUKA